jgi:hypothetical protein
MKVELVSHSFPDRPDWILVNEEIPLGTQYELLGYERNATVVNMTTSEARKIELYLLEGRESIGWIPAICFRIIPSEVN